MNNQQRKTLASLTAATKTTFETAMEACKAENVSESEATVQVLAVRESIGKLLETVEDMVGDEQDKFDNMSDGLQASSRGEAIQEAIDALDSATGDLQMLFDTFDLKDNKTWRDIDWDDASSDLETVCDDLECI